MLRSTLVSERVLGCLRWKCDGWDMEGIYKDRKQDDPDGGFSVL